MDLGILNTIIALVVVLLVLSLLVQAIQTLLKKVLKLKSRQIEDSLKDLYEQVVSTPAETTPSSPSPAEVFKDKVLEQFKSIGRQTLFGNPVLDSLSKSDLFKVMGKLESEDFFPDYVPKFQLLCDQIASLRQAIEDITNDPMLRGAASTKIAEIRSILAPIFNNVESILDGKQVKPKVLFADLLRLGQIDFHGLLNLLVEAQQAITKETEVATTAGNASEVAALQKLSAELAQVSRLIGDLSQKFVDAISPLRNKIDQVELWFDTVTQSFDERYTRHMRTISIAISIVVVIVLNANFFQVYKSLSQNDIQRKVLVDAGADLVKNNEQKATATPTASPSPDTVAEINKDLQDIDSLVGTYESFGFRPLGAAQLQSFFWGTGIWTKPWGSWAGFSNDLQNENNWHAQTGAEWWQRRKDDLVTLVGWAIMVMLLRDRKSTRLNSSHTS